MREIARIGVLKPCLLGGLLLLGGCDENGQRPCAAFGLPLAEEWSTVASIGEAATFESATGNVTLVLASREDSEPYTGTDRFGGPEEGGVRDELDAALPPRRRHGHGAAHRDAAD